LRIEQDDSRGRKGYEVYIEGRVLKLANKESREELTEEWRGIRRGWYLGKSNFRQRLEEHLGGVLKGKARQSYSGGAKKAHDEAAAEAMMVRGLAALGLRNEDLAVLAKGAPEKQVLAWWLKKRTVVSRLWIARRLGMGDESRVTQTAGVVGRAKDRRTRAWQKRLETMDSWIPGLTL
jgi:hypothetical protein